MYLFAYYTFEEKLSNFWKEEKILKRSSLFPRGNVQLKSFMSDSSIFSRNKIFLKKVISGSNLCITENMIKSIDSTFSILIFFFFTGVNCVALTVKKKNRTYSLTPLTTSHHCQKTIAGNRVEYNKRIKCSDTHFRK